MLHDLLLNLYQFLNFIVILWIQDTLLYYIELSSHDLLKSFL
jgi:hypothetical protein